jgi:hypothetical protein
MKSLLLSRYLENDFLVELVNLSNVHLGARLLPMEEVEAT